MRESKGCSTYKRAIADFAAALLFCGRGGAASDKFYFDYVVVGAGSAGSVAASYLARSAGDVSVALLEAGGKVCRGAVKFQDAHQVDGSNGVFEIAK